MAVKLTYDFPEMQPDERLRELILYISERCVSDPQSSATRLNKILFYSDFLSFARHGKPITGSAYKAIEHGPAPRGLNFVRDRMLDMDEILIRKFRVYTRERHQIIPKREANLDFFSARDIKIVDEMIAHFMGTSADQASKASHNRAWYIARDSKAAGGSDLIPYEAIFISDEAVTASDITRAQELNARFHWEQRLTLIRKLVDEPKYSEQLAKLGDVRYLDEALRSILWGITTSAERFDLVTGFKTLRIAKSWVTKLRIYFIIQGEQVSLRWIERMDEPGLFDDDEEENW